MNKMSEQSVAKYLRITIHDNDFLLSLKQLSEMLYEIFLVEGRFPEEDDLPLLEKYVKHLWFSLNNIGKIMRWNKTCVGFNASSIEIFSPILDFVNYPDIPKCEDNESVYIPMFEDAEIIIR